MSVTWSVIFTNPINVRTPRYAVIADPIPLKLLSILLDDSLKSSDMLLVALATLRCPASTSLVLTLTSYSTLPALSTDILFPLVVQSV